MRIEDGGDMEPQYVTWCPQNRVARVQSVCVRSSMVPTVRAGPSAGVAAAPRYHVALLFPPLQHPRRRRGAGGGAADMQLQFGAPDTQARLGAQQRDAECPPAAGVRAPLLPQGASGGDFGIARDSPRGCVPETQARGGGGLTHGAVVELTRKLEACGVKVRLPPAAFSHPAAAALGRGLAAFSPRIIFCHWRSLVEARRFLSLTRHEACARLNVPSQRPHAARASVSTPATARARATTLLACPRRCSSSKLRAHLALSLTQVQLGPPPGVLSAGRTFALLRMPQPLLQAC